MLIVGFKGWCGKYGRGLVKVLKSLPRVDVGEKDGLRDV